MKNTMTTVEASVAQDFAVLDKPPSDEIMEYTSVLPICKLQELIEDKKVLLQKFGIISLPGINRDEELVAPTVEGKKILFELTTSNFHDISEQFDHEICTFHQTSQAKSLAIYICLSKQATFALDTVDNFVKSEYRSKIALKKSCPMWFPLVKLSMTDESVLSVDVVLDNSDAPTQILILNTDKSIVEGSGSEFLLENIGGLENIKDYTCNPVLELTWVLRHESLESHRLSIKAHSILLKKKVKEPPMKRFKMSIEKIEALKQNKLLIFTSSS